AKSRSFSIEVENSSIRGADERRDQGIGVRCIIDKKIGFAYVTSIEKEDVRDCVSRSVSLARAAIEDPDFSTLPSMESRYPSISGLYDKEIASLSSEEAANLIVRVVDSTKASLEKRNYAIAAGIQTSSSISAVVNSLGVSASGEKTLVSIYSYPTIKEGEEQTASYEYQVSRALSEIDPEHVGKTAAEMAVMYLNPRTSEGGEMPVVFAPLGVSTVLGSGFGGAVNAEEVQYGRSYISDAIGDQIASEALEITDNGVLPGGMGSRSYDAEGVPSQKTPILEDGVLKSLLHNSFTANKEDADNTANASRPSYSGVPGISPSNFIVTPGKGDLDDLVSEIERGVLCRNTADRPNMTTGELSAMIMEGFYIENGEMVHPLKNTLIGINMLDLLKRVNNVGSDVRTTFTMVTPSLVIEKAMITSG
ncbi:TldD/PmbA family protein, partial [Candidatus Thorarchaeota archaeon]